MRAARGRQPRVGQPGIREHRPDDPGREDEALGAPVPATRPTPPVARVDPRVEEADHPRPVTRPQDPLQVLPQRSAVVQEDVVLEEHICVRVRPLETQFGQSEVPCRPGPDPVLAPGDRQVGVPVRDANRAVEEQEWFLPPCTHHSVQAHLERRLPSRGGRDAEPPFPNRVATAPLGGRHDLVERQGPGDSGSGRPVVTHPADRGGGPFVPGVATPVRHGSVGRPVTASPKWDVTCCHGGTEPVARYRLPRWCDPTGVGVRHVQRTESKLTGLPGLLDTVREGLAVREHAARCGVQEARHHRV